MEYVSVILPLRLGWAPLYGVPQALESKLERGDRVRVPLGERVEEGVVLETGVTPGMDASRIQTLIGKSEGMEKISRTELGLWEFISSYYLCSLGEVYKCAYGAARISSERKAAGPRARKPRFAGIPALPEPCGPADAETLKSFAKATEGGKTALRTGSFSSRLRFYVPLIRDALSKGGSVLMLVPGIELGKDTAAQLEEIFGDCLIVYNSTTTTALRRDIAARVRKGGPLLLVGTRSAVFLPFKKLSLVIVDEEQDRAYKQDSPAPRYNARDCALMLAKLHGAKALLGSECPSLETVYNCNSGRYTLIPGETPCGSAASRLTIIDTLEEKRKNGMSGQLSVKLIEKIRKALTAGAPVCLLRIWGDTAATVAEMEQAFPGTPVFALGEESFPEGGKIAVGTVSTTRDFRFPEGSLVAILQADPVLGARDFRADERALQLFRRYLSHCSSGSFVIQTGRSSHPVFRSMLSGSDPFPELLAERRLFFYPPYTRIVDALVRDSNQARLSAMSKALYSAFCAIPGLISVFPPYPSAEGEATIRLVLEKGRGTATVKEEVRKAAQEFERKRKYASHIRLDVDPD